MRPVFLLLPLLVACSDEKSSDTAAIEEDGNPWSDGAASDGGVDDGGSDGGSDGGDDDAGGEDDAGDPAFDIEGTVGLTSGHVIDPKLMGEPILPISVTLTDTETCETTLIFSNGIGQTHTVASPEETTDWDGRDEEGHAFDPGVVSIQLNASCGKDERTLDQATAYIVRLSPHIIDLASPADEPGQVGLAFHKKSLLDSNVSPVGERPEYKQEPVGVLGSAIDRDDGTPRPSVPLWANAHVPPWTEGEVKQHNVPTGYVTGSPIMAMVEFDSVAVSEARHIAVSPWGPEPEKAPTVRLVSNEALVTLDAPVEIALGEAAGTMGRHILTIDWRFESEGEDGAWHPIPGMFETHHAYYVLAGQPALLDGSDFGASPAVPWIGVLEDTAELFEGVPATIEDTLDTLRDYLFYHDYLLYDPGSGTYSDFEGDYMYWSSITAEVSSFLDRREGLSLYCHSMSCMLSALAGNHGVRAEQIVLGVNFTTNLTRAAGSDNWRAWSFNSHSVVTPDDGETIWDASIALDGDDAPDDDDSIEEVMPRGMSGEEYMWRLSYDDIGIINQGLCYIE